MEQPIYYSILYCALKIVLEISIIFLEIVEAPGQNYDILIITPKLNVFILLYCQRVPLTFCGTVSSKHTGCLQC